MATDMEYLTRSVDRNRYFYGKLMTVRDFLREQEYFNSKRWLVNRLLFGSGIVCGLETAEVGTEPTTTVEIQPGVAFDLKGHEITVSEVARVNLAKLDTEGLAPGGGTGETNLLVCLNYHECPKEPVPSLGGSPCEEACESNRVGETYTVSLLKAPPEAEPPTPCETWLNRQTVRRPLLEPQASDNFLVQRIAPVWVRPGDVFEVALKVTALKDVNGVFLSETVVGGTIIEPNPQPPTQFPTPPLSLRKGEFFVYVYQVQAPATTGTVQLAGGAGVPTPPASVDVLNDAQAKAREAELRLGGCPTDPVQPPPVPIATVKATFTSGTLTGVKVVDTFNQQRFRYSLSRVAELLDCVRASLRAEAESERPGHLFITFKDLENTDLLPIGPAVDHGKSFTVPRGDHVHALLLYNNSGLQFVGNRLRVEGDVGGEKINFLKTVSGQDPTEPQHLTTKHYVDSRIAGLDWQESALTRKFYEPPDEPKEGDRYLVSPVPPDVPKPSARNPWAKHVGSIAEFNGKTWDYAEPDEGTAVFIEDENIAYLYVEGKWIPFLATPDVAAGDGLRADGAVISVGQGAGLKVNPNDVEVVFEANPPLPVGSTPGAGTAATAARGDHTHDLPLTPNGGLAFGRLIGLRKEGEELLPDKERPDLRGGLHINGLVGGANIDFLHPVWGQTPTEPRQLATKQYVDGVAAGLDWQNSVLDKDRNAPPEKPDAGARYLILGGGGIIIDPRGEEGGEKSEKGEESLREPPPEPEPVPLPLPKGDWAGHQNSIAAWDGSAWSFTEPNEGMAVFVEDENTAYLFVEGKWVPFMAMPSVAAGAGLRADGARLSVGEGSGLRVNEDDVEVVYNAANPSPVGPVTFTGASATAARGDHTHELPLALSGGLEFIGTGKEGEPAVDDDKREEPPASLRLRVNGRINGDGIDFLFPVLGQDPVAPRHLATKQYVDGVTAGLTWQSTVLDKDLSEPPKEPQKDDRYLLFEKTANGTPWEGQQDNIATWAGKRWEFIAPVEGMAAFVADENLAYLYADGKWVQFLAPPATVSAGAGLFEKGGELNVGQGEGVLVTADAVSVDFGDAEPLSIGIVSDTGSSPHPARADHTHDISTAPDSGLAWIGVLYDANNSRGYQVLRGDDLAKGSGVMFLRIDGTVGGDSIDFLYPVSGQTPTDARHLATKEYVDAHGGGGGGVVAGDGLIGKENVLSVGGGPGLLVGADDVHVNFEDGAPQPVGEVPNPGRSNTVARGDHVHAMPDVWGTSVSTGVVAFNMRRAGQQRHTFSLPIDPELGTGLITVVVGLESEVEGEGTFVGEIEYFEEAMFEGGGFRRFPSVLVGTTILPPGSSKDFKNTTFEIWAQATRKSEVLPELFRVRWWAYRAGRDLGTIDYTPPGTFDR